MIIYFRLLGKTVDRIACQGRIAESAYYIFFFREIRRRHVIDHPKINVYALGARSKVVRPVVFPFLQNGTVLKAREAHSVRRPNDEVSGNRRRESQVEPVEVG